ncbi:MAG TPA: acetyl-CoA acetyltransferase [Myxococcota bacterium]|nr:acetyl-CoA acetyltransferase [Myxococcota bacterium]
MPGEDRTPVLVGVAQLTLRDASIERALEPIAMLEQVARDAAEDAGLGERLLHSLDSVAIVNVLGWRATNPAAFLAERIGAQPKRTILTGTGGEIPLVLLGHMASEIEAGRSRAALVAGCNTLRTALRARRAGRRFGWATGPESSPFALGVHKAGSSELENLYGLSTPPVVYPIFENALRARRGLSLEAHRLGMGRLMSRMSAVAAKNPHAWFPVARDPEELTKPSPQNRMIAFPYPKYLNAVIETDQAACALVLSAAHARELGIAENLWVHLWAAAAATEDIWFPTQRASFAECSALRRAATEALARAGTALGEMDAMDFYSCFPVAVEMACEMLGLSEDDPRGFTVTGGLPYAGGPGNNYTLHAVAAMVERLREVPGRRGLVTGNGWYLTKHSACVLASAPRPQAAAKAAFAPPDEAAPTAPKVRQPELAEAASGPAAVETYTVTYDREGAPERGIVVGRLLDGRRFLAHTPGERALLEDFAAHEGVGRKGAVSHENGKNLFTPA